MQGYFDIHCHILPGIDDGPKNFDETIRMLYIAYEEGIRFIVATPHYGFDNTKVSLQQTQKLYEELNTVINNAGIKISILLGSELLFSSDIVDALNKGDALTIDGTRYILVEFPRTALYKDIWNGINQCVFGGYIPILAHVERYKCLIKDPYLVEDLILLGAYIQINLSSVKGKLLDKEALFCRKLLKKGWVHFLGTDAHGAYERIPRVNNYVKYLRRRYGQDRIQQLFWDNPMTMVENRHL